MPQHDHLVELLDDHLPPARVCFGFETGVVYLPDFLVGGFLQRSFHLLEGFLAALESWNVIVAAPLVRLQIDNLLRLSYLAGSVDLDEVTVSLLQGTELRKLKDAEGKRLTDARLRELARPHHPWIDRVYPKASAWVHFSGAHIQTAYRVNSSSATYEGAFPLRSTFIPKGFVVELMGAMGQATEELLEYLAQWAEHKSELAVASGADDSMIGNDATP